MGTLGLRAKGACGASRRVVIAASIHRSGKPRTAPSKITRFGLIPATPLSYLRAMEFSPYAAATLATKGHVFCVGTLAQCLRRWNRLPNHSKPETYLKMGRDGVAPTILRGDQIEELASNPKLIRA
jgi:hypothetical protein